MFIELFEKKQDLNATVELRQRHNIHRKTNHLFTFQPLLWVALNHLTKTESILNLTFYNISPILNNTHAAEDTFFTLDEIGVIRITQINWEMRQCGDTSCQRRREEELGAVFIKSSTSKKSDGGEPLQLLQVSKVTGDTRLQETMDEVKGSSQKVPVAIKLTDTVRRRNYSGDTEGMDLTQCWNLILHTS